MKFTEEKKQALINYILEKIDAGEERLASTVKQAFGINESTLYSYLNSLLDDGIIKKVKRNKYELAQAVHTFELERSKKELDSDTYAYTKYIYDLVKNFSSNVEQMWAYAFSEMTNNVMDHSQAENASIIVEQNYLYTRIWLIDDGVGIFEKIRKYFGLTDVNEAIGELFKGKVTTDAKNHSGEGIFFSSRMMDEFYIISDGVIFSHDKFNDDFIKSAPLPYATGTCVMMKLNNNSKRTPKEVFSRYENEDGGFDKTEITLKNIFNSSPISRSQAKRLCSGMEKFSCVELNFSEIEWMGQGFAHQLFVVFAAEHPGVELTPVNMNEDVKRMYNHVMK